MDIPVFHDDQHGTAIIATAGLINALHLTGRDIKTTKLVCNGAGAAGIACVELVKAMGMPGENILLCDTKGVVYKGRTEGMNQWKSAHAVDTPARTLADAMEGADVVFGLSAKGALTPEMIRSMAPKPIIFAMANPDPGDARPEEVAEVRDDAIVATGRSDYPNQVNNVLGFPYIFRGALDVRARQHQRGDEDRRGRGARRPRPRGRARRGGRRLSGPPAEIRHALHHPGALRPAPDQRDSGGGGQGGDGIGRGAEADPRHGGLQDAAFRPPRPDRRHAAAHLPAGQAGRRSASSSPRARRSRRSAPR